MPNMDTNQISIAVVIDILLTMSLNVNLSFLTTAGRNIQSCTTLLTTHTLLPSEAPTHPSSPEKIPTPSRFLHTAETYEEALRHLPALPPTTSYHDHMNEVAMSLLHPAAAAAYSNNLPLPEEIHAPPPSLHTKETYAEALRKMPPLPPATSLCDTGHEIAMKMLEPATAAAYRKNVMSANRVPCSAPSPATTLPPQNAEYISSGDENDQSSMGVAVANLLSSQAASDLHASFEQGEKRVIELDEDGKDLKKKRRAERRAAREAKDLKRRKEANSDDEDDDCI